MIPFMLVPANDNGGAAHRAIMQGDTLLAVPDDVVEFARFAQFQKKFAPPGIELGAEIVADDAERPLDRHAPAVGAGAGHGIEGIADADDACIDGNLIKQ